MHSDDEDADFFSKTEYKSKKDIINAVCQYNKNCHRAFKVVSSDHRRYKAVCVDDSCSFIVLFSFSSSFKKPSKFIPHSCSYYLCYDHV
jgi:hypothetical protein